MVYIILVNYNGWRDTIQCIQSLCQIKQIKTHVIVVDNQSVDDSVNNMRNWLKDELDFNISIEDLLIECRAPYELLNIRWKITETNEWKDIDEGIKQQSILAKDSIDLTILKNGRNIGFAKANNLAIQIALKDATCKYVWVLNNDTLVKHDSLKLLIEQWNQCQTEGINVGLIGSTLVYYYSPEVIQSSGGKLNKYLGIAKNINGNKPFSVIQKMPPKYKVDFIIGAAMFCHRNYIETVGYLPEDYFLYYEDVEWSINGNRSGYENIVCRDSIVYHKEGNSIGSDSNGCKKSDSSDYYSLKNRIKFIKKNYPYFLPSTLLGFLLVIINRIKRKKIHVLISLLLRRPPVNYVKKSMV